MHAEMGEYARFSVGYVAMFAADVVLRTEKLICELCS
jgi:hypothetical protein